MKASHGKRILSILLVFALVCSALIACTNAPEAEANQAEKASDGTKQKLIVANWQSYATDDDFGAAAFAEKYDCEVEHYYISSIPELMQTLLNGGTEEIDVININPLYMQEYYAAGLLDVIDVSQLGSYEDLMDTFSGIDAVRDESGNILGVPWVWGSTSLFYNGDIVTEDINSWKALWDPQYKGLIGFFDEYDTAIKTAAMYLGEDPYHPDLEKVKAALLELKANCKVYWGSNDALVKPYIAKEIVIGNSWGSTATQLYNDNYNIKFVYPEEGTVGFCDYWCLVKGSKEKDLAMKWIDFCTSEDFQYNMATAEKANTPANRETMAKLDDETRKKLWIYPQAPDNLVLSLPMDADEQAAWMNLWNEIKASN